MCVLVTHSYPTLWDLMDYSPPGSFVHGISPGKNIGVGCPSFLQGIFPTKGLLGSNPGLLYRRHILYQATREAACPDAQSFPTNELLAWVLHLTITLPVAQGYSYFPLTLYNQSLESGPHLLVQINMFIFQISYLSHSLPRVLCSSMAAFCSLSLITVTRKMTTFV